MSVAKTKALISFTVTAKLICVFVFAYAKSRFSHNAAQIMLSITLSHFIFLLVLSNIIFTCCTCISSEVIKMF